MTNMNWDDLRFVLALARSKALSRAAEGLGVTHTTVARRLRALEEQLGSKIFEQSHEGFVPTSAGERLVEVAGRVEMEMHSLDRDILGQDSSYSGPLRVATLDVFVVWFSDVFRSFAERYPEVELEFVTGKELANLNRRDADVALRATGSPPEYLVGKQVGEMDFRIYAAQSLIQRAGHRDFRQLPWLRWDERMGARMTDAWIDENVPNARVAARVDSAPVMLELCRQGMGAAFLPCIAARCVEGLLPISDVFPDFRYPIWMLTHPDLRKTARVKAFREHVQAGIANYHDALAGKTTALAS